MSQRPRPVPGPRSPHPVAAFPVLLAVAIFPVLLAVAVFPAVLAAEPAAAPTDPAASAPTDPAGARVVDLASADGTKLKGTFFPAAKPAPAPGVLLLHQCDQDRRIWDGLARRLAKAGLNVMTFDLRHFGESEGGAAERFGRTAVTKWPDDVDAAFRYLVSQPGVNREVIGVAGASCGVNNAIQAARRHPEVKSLVLLAGPTNAEGRRFLRASPGLPILFGYADDDQYPETITTTQWLYRLHPNPGKRLVSYPDGKHGAEIFKAHPEFEETITDWYLTTLVRTPGKAPAAAPVAVPRGVETLTALEEPGDAAAAMAQLAQARASDPRIAAPPEDILNELGYERLRTGDVKGGLAILKFIAEAYPVSANAQDSLADAYVAAGQPELARASAKRALDLLPADPAAQDERRREAIRKSAEAKLK